MADIELVIKIPEGLKKDFELEQWTALSCMEMKNALMNSTPLPKGHVRLIDADSMKTMKNIQSANFNAVELIRLWIDNQPTIIEKDGD